MRQLRVQACLDRASALCLIGVAIPHNRHRLERGRGERTHPVLAGARNHQYHWCPLDFVLYLQVVWKRLFFLFGGETSVSAGHSEQELACQRSDHPNGKYEVSLFCVRMAAGPWNCRARDQTRALQQVAGWRSESLGCSGASALCCRTQSRSRGHAYDVSVS